MWYDEIGVTLKIDSRTAAENVLTVPDVICITEGSGLQTEQTALPGQWVLIPENGSVLPVSLLVKLGKTEYVVYADGRSNPEGIKYDAENGILCIENSLLLNSEGVIRIMANGYSEQESMKDNEDKEQIFENEN